VEACVLTVPQQGSTLLHLQRQMQLTFQHPWLHMRQVLQQQLQLVCRKQHGRCCMQPSLHQGPAACLLEGRPARLLQQQLQQGWLVCLLVLVVLLCRAVSGRWKRLICHHHWQHQ
jgi:hypothetical protein